MKFIACAVVALTALATDAKAGDWRIVDIGREGARLLDAETVRSLPMSSKKVAWLAVIPMNPDDGEDYVLYQHEWDCAEQTATLTAIHAFSAEGESLRRSSLRGETLPVVPDTAGQTLLRAVCESVYLSPASIPSIREFIPFLRGELREGMAGES